MKVVVLFVIFTFGFSLANAHSRLKASDVIKVRSTDPGVKTAPCGGYARNIAPAQLTGGQTIPVTWEETIYHPGRFEFYFSQANDQNFKLLKSVDNTQNNQQVPHQFSTTVTLPNVDCQACTLQMIQVMAENPAAPTYYYSCADMQVKASAVTAPTPTPPAENCPSP